jgi:hypothetical protein
LSKQLNHQSNYTIEQDVLGHGYFENAPALNQYIHQHPGVDPWSTLHAEYNAQQRHDLENAEDSGKKHEHAKDLEETSEATPTPMNDK